MQFFTVTRPFVGTSAKMNNSVFCLFILAVSTAAEPLRFLAVGDWGDDDGYQAEVAMAMGTWAANRKPEFVLSLGDNFYPNGVSSVNDTQWETKWRQMYLDKESLQIPWYVMAGNHDHRIDVNVEIEYSQIEPLWIFPSLYYKFTKMAGNASVEFVVYDTHVIERDLEQQDWLLNTVSSSTADWLIVTAHTPIYSTGLHGMRWEFYWVEKNLRPLLEEHNASFYVCGHDHDQQHIIKNGTQVDYVITGGGHSKRFANPTAHWQMKQKGASLVWRKSSLGFAEFEIEDNTATVQYINENNEIIYSFTKVNQRIDS